MVSERPALGQGQVNMRNLLSVTGEAQTGFLGFSGNNISRDMVLFFCEYKYFDLLFYGNELHTIVE